MSMLVRLVGGCSRDSRGCGSYYTCSYYYTCYHHIYYIRILLHTCPRTLTRSPAPVYTCVFFFSLPHTARCSALHLAASRGHTQLAAMLVDKGAELEAEDASGKTPLHWAAARGQVAAAEVLCRVGASCEARDVLEKTPLHLAAHAGHASFVDFLIAGCGCDVGAHDVFNATAAHFAARCGRGHVLELLLQGGCKLQALDAAMWSPLHWAETHNHSHICARLRSLGCSTEGEPVSPNSLPDVDDLVDMASGPLADLRYACSPLCLLL